MCPLKVPLFMKKAKVSNKPTQKFSIYKSLARLGQIATQALKMNRERNAVEIVEPRSASILVYSANISLIIFWKFRKFVYIFLSTLNKYVLST